MLGSQAIVDRYHNDVGRRGNRPTDLVVGVKVADHPPTPVEENHDRPIGRHSSRAVDPNREVLPVPTEDDTVGHRTHLRPPRPEHLIEEGASVLRARLGDRRTPRLDHGIE